MNYGYQQTTGNYGSSQQGTRYAQRNAGNGSYGQPSLPPQQQRQPSYLNNFQSFNPVTAQMRLLKAQQLNTLCKHAMVRNHILSTYQQSLQSAVAQSSMDTNLTEVQDPVHNSHPHLKDVAKKVGDASNFTRKKQHRMAESTPDQYDKLQVPVDGDETTNRKLSPDSSQQSHNGKPAEIEKDEPLVDSVKGMSQSDQSDDDTHGGPGKPSDFDGEFLSSNEATAARQAADKLNNLAEEMTKALDNTKTDLETQKEVRSKHKKKKHKESRTVPKKKKPEDVIKINKDDLLMLMPLWRHKLEGRPNPPESCILKGKRLFRVVVRAILNMILKPILANLKRQLQRRETERKDLEKTLKIISGGFDDWIGKIVQLPVSSITQDITLNFEPRESYVTKAQPLRIRLLQLKVRLRGVVTYIAQSDMPSDFITDFLVTLVEDNNYYSAGQLWECEIDQLDFTSLGATRDMLPVVDDSESAAAPIVDDSKEAITQTGRNDENENDIATIGLTEETQKKVKISRTRLILQNFILLRVLVAHLLLSPWNYNISGQPSSRSLKRTIYNYRFLATCMYEMVRSLDSSLPEIEEVPFRGAITTEQPTAAAVRSNVSGAGGKQDETAALAASAAATASTTLAVTESTNVSTNAPGPMLSLSSRKFVQSTRVGFGTTIRDKAIADEEAAQQAARARLATETAAEKAQDDEKSTADGANPGTSSNSTAADADKSKGQQEGVEELGGFDVDENGEIVAKEATGLMGKFAKLLGMADTAPGVDTVSMGSIESYLLGNRSEYCSLQELHSLLLPESKWKPVRSQIDEWLADLKPSLSDWLHRLVLHVLQRQLEQQKAAKDKKEKL